VAQHFTRSDVPPQKVPIKFLPRRHVVAYCTEVKMARRTRGLLCQLFVNC